jgi:hypothetical protein
MATGTNALSGVGRRQTWRHGGGISLLRSGSAAHRAAGAETVMPYFLGLLARACEIAGQLKEAVTQFDDALQSADRTGACWFAAELNRRKGRLLLRQGHTEAAEKRIDCRVKTGDCRRHTFGIKFIAFSAFDPSGVRDAICHMQHRIRVREARVKDVRRRDRFREQGRQSRKHCPDTISREGRDLQPTFLPIGRSPTGGSGTTASARGGLSEVSAIPRKADPPCELAKATISERISSRA